MSGGHFNYGCFQCSEFFFRVKKSLEDIENGNEEYPPDLNEETKLKLHCLIDIMEQLDPMLREIEWIWSGDTSNESFLKAIDKPFNKLLFAVFPQWIDKLYDYYEQGM